MVGELKRKLAIAMIGLVLLLGICYQGAKQFGFWGQLGSQNAVTIIDGQGQLATPDQPTPAEVEPEKVVKQANNPVASSSGQEASAPGEQSIMVHVVGAVSKPGVYQLPKGARIFQAVEKAGATKEAALGFINLAQSIQDGEQIIVPSKAEVTATAGSIKAGTRSGVVASSARTGQRTASSGLININTANQTQLDALPGIGPAMAQRIMAYRQTNGPFKSVQDIQKVSGIGAKKYQGLASRVCI